MLENRPEKFQSENEKKWSNGVNVKWEKKI